MRSSASLPCRGHPRSPGAHRDKLCVIGLPLPLFKRHALHRPRLPHPVWSTDDELARLALRPQEHTLLPSRHKLGQRAKDHSRLPLDRLAQLHASCPSISRRPSCRRAPSRNNSTSERHTLDPPTIFQDVLHRRLLVRPDYHVAIQAPELRQERKRPIDHKVPTVLLGNIVANSSWRPPPFRRCTPRCLLDPPTPSSARLVRRDTSPGWPPGVLRRSPDPHQGSHPPVETRPTGSRHSGGIPLNRMTFPPMLGISVPLAAHARSPSCLGSMGDRRNHASGYMCNPAPESNVMGLTPPDSNRASTTYLPSCTRTSIRCPIPMLHHLGRRRQRLAAPSNMELTRCGSSPDDVVDRADLDSWGLLVAPAQSPIPVSSVHLRAATILSIQHSPIDAALNAHPGGVTGGPLRERVLIPGVLSLVAVLVSVDSSLSMLPVSRRGDGPPRSDHAISDRVPTPRRRSPRKSPTALPLPQSPLFHLSSCFSPNRDSAIARPSTPGHRVLRVLLHRRSSA